MFYKSLDIPRTARNTIDTFLGYNHNHRISDGEFYDMENMSADEYPALSPRRQRTCILTLQKNDWEPIDTYFTSRLDSQVSGMKAVYSSGKIQTNEHEEIRVSFNVNPLQIRLATVTVYFYSDGEYHSETVIETREGIEEIFEMSEGVTEYEVVIKGTPVTPEEYKVDNLSTSITDISVKLHSWNIQGMLLKNGKLAYMAGNKLYYDGREYDFSSFVKEDGAYRTKQQLVSFGAHILIFPLGFYLNTNNLEHGPLGAEYIAGYSENEVVFTMSDASGNEITASETKPESPENGTYWLDTSDEKPGLYKWSESMDMWVGVSSTYIRISIDTGGESGQRFPDMFKEGDAIHMNSGIEDIDNGSVVVKKGYTFNEDGSITGGYVVVKGMLAEQIVKSVDKENTMVFKRKIPKLDYVCVSNNRVWGCYSGQIENADIVNEIYACKLGDPKNWYCYEGAATDSYALSLGDDGEFTGAFTYQGYPMFFKENVVYKIYGSYPAAYQLYTYNCRGVQKGSDRSLAIVNEYLMYKSVQDVCVFDGNTPTSVSRALGNKKYSEAAAGACMGKYYLSMKDEEGNSELFVFDIERGIWHREDNLRLEEFSYNNNGELYGRNQLSVYGFGNAKTMFGQEKASAEDTVQWMAETGGMGTEYLEKKYINAIHLRAYIPSKSMVDIYAKNEGEDWRKLQTLRGNDETKVYRIPVVQRRNDSFRLKLEGYGPCRIYSLTKEIEKGSDK